MPIFKNAPRRGGAIAAAVMALAASATFAADRPQNSPASDVIVSQQVGDTRSVRVSVSDLDMADAYDRETLAIRIDRAAKAVCDINRGSKLDRFTDANECLDRSLADAAQQLDAHGLRQSARMVAGGQP